MKLFGKMKTYIRKYIRKYIPVLCTLFLIPCISFNAFADTISVDYTSTYVYTDSIIVTSFNNGSIDLNTGLIVNDSPIGTISLSSANLLNSYKFAHNHVTSQLFILFTNPWDYPYLPDLYDYYFVLGHYSWINNFNADKIYLYSRNKQEPLNEPFLDADFDTYKITSLEHFGNSYAFKVDPNQFCSISGVSLLDADGGLIQDTLHLWFKLVPIPKNANDEQVDSIISAINNQTDIIENGNEDTQSAVSDFNEVFEDFNEELDNIEEFDNQIIGEFESANEQYLTELNNFSLSASLLNAGNWLSTSMQTVYDNSSDYKMLWLVPLLLGIPLIILFLKKGSDDE